MQQTGYQGDGKEPEVTCEDQRNNNKFERLNNKFERLNNKFHEMEDDMEIKKVRRSAHTIADDCCRGDAKSLLSTSITCGDSIVALLPSTVEMCNALLPEFDVDDPGLFVEILRPELLHIALALGEVPPGLRQGVDPQDSAQIFREWLIEFARHVPGVTAAKRVGDQLSLCWHHLSDEQVTLIICREWQHPPWMTAIPAHIDQPFCQVVKMTGTGLARAHLYVWPRVFGF